MVEMTRWLRSMRIGRDADGCTGRQGGRLTLLFIFDGSRSLRLKLGAYLLQQLSEAVVGSRPRAYAAVCMVHVDRRRPATGHRGRVRLFGRKVVAARKADCLVLSCICVALSRREEVVGKHKLLV